VPRDQTFPSRAGSGASVAPMARLCLFHGPGATAEDSLGHDSPFAKALLVHLGDNGLELGPVHEAGANAGLRSTLARQLPYIEDALAALFFAGAQTGQLPENDRLLLAMAKIDADTRAQAYHQGQGCAAGAALRLARRQRGPVGQGEEAREKLLVQLADDLVKVRADLQTLAQLQTQAPSSAVLAAWLPANDGTHSAELEHLAEASLTGRISYSQSWKDHYDALKGDSTR